ncbi:hypothetical protein F4780DRAFT_774433 [Xylariomycetidae sp. FL0641]|nr:hypothetical protein F4780DRAFT_774433 [Xylariomycetidae sp. FL0641]
MAGLRGLVLHVRKARVAGRYPGRRPRALARQEAGHPAGAGGGLRYVFRPRVMRIDALGINQQTLDERSLQVRRMGNGALVERVGPAGETRGLAAIRTLDCLHRQADRGHGRWPPAGFARRDDLWQREWFTRPATVRDILLGAGGSVVQCGSQQATSTAPAASTRTPWSSGPRPERPPSHRRAGCPRATPERPRAVDRPLRTPGSAARTPGDKIYGLAGQPLARRFRLDYRWSHRDLYRHAFAACLDVEDRLGHVAVAGRR